VGVGGKGGGGGRGEKWPKHCVHIWIKKKMEKWMAVIILAITYVGPVTEENTIT
jgi:hypothetical protein